jgi:hypothetical protein
MICPIASYRAKKAARKATPKRRIIRLDAISIKVKIPLFVRLAMAPAP